VATPRICSLSFAAVLFAAHGPADAATVSGRLTRSAGGAAIEGATVTLLLRPFAPPVRSALTDATGNYSFAGVPEGTYIAVTQPDGFIGEAYDNLTPIDFSTATAITLGPDEVRADIDFALDEPPPVHRVSGVVRRDGDATPVEGTTVTIESADGTPIGSGASDAAGAFAIDVPSGEYRIRSDSAGGLLGEYSDGTPCTVLVCDGSSAATIQVVDDDIAGVDFALARGGSIAGQLRDAVRAGAPMGLVRVAIYPSDGIASVTSIESDTGAYQTGVGLPSGTYRAAASIDAGGYRAQVYDGRDCGNETIFSCDVPLGEAIVVVAGATTAAIDFDLAPTIGTISGTVREFAGAAPLANVRVVLTTGFSAAPVQETLTAADGSYAFVSAPGAFAVYADPAPPLALEYFPNLQCESFFNGCVSAPPPIALTAGAAITAVDFALAPIATVEVALRNASTLQIVAGELQVQREGVHEPFSASSQGAAPVLLRVPDGGSLLIAGTGASVCGAGGDLPCLGRLYPDVPCPNLRCRLDQGETIAVTKGVSLSGIELLLTPSGVIAGRVTRAGGGLPLNAAIEASTGVLVVGTALVASDQGDYEITGLDVGPYVVRTRSDVGVVDEVYDDVPCQGNCSLADAVLVATTPGIRTENIDFALSPGARIGGTVRNSAGGSGIRNATITFFDATGEPVTTASTLADGTFLSPALGTGRYFVRAGTPNHFPALFDGAACSAASCVPTTGTPIDLLAPADRAGVDFVLVLDPDTAPPPTILYLNRCADGCTLTAGFESSINDTSSIISGTRQLSPFPFGDQRFAEIVACVANVFSPFNFKVTTTDPGNVPHYEHLIVPSNAQAGFSSGTGGVSPFSCGMINNSITFTFTNYWGDNLAAICDTVAMEVAHSFGLEHEVDCRDPMTYLAECGPKFFVDADLPCGEFSPRTCECNAGTTQNSFQLLLERVGPRVLLFEDGFEAVVTTAQMTKAYEASLVKAASAPRGPFCATRGSLDP
jgi:hypothetical protein